MHIRQKLYSLFICTSLLACSMAPEYKVPDVYMTEKYKASFMSSSRWVAFDQIKFTEFNKPWWTAFEDKFLNTLINQLNIRNYTIEQAVAKYEASNAQIKSAQASYFPSVGLDASASKSGGSNRAESDKFNYGSSLKWEIDLWGKLSDKTNIARLDSEIQSLTIEQTQLGLQAQLANTYFSLRETDLKISALEKIISYLEKSNHINKNLYNQGVIAKADVISSDLQLLNAKAELVATQSSRIQLENAISTLIGLTPGEFRIESERYELLPAKISVSYPSLLLAMRPDIKIAEKRVQEANYKIGVSKSAWFPNLTLSASVANQAIAINDLISSPATVWSLGPALVLSIFDGGSKRAALNSAKADYRFSVAAYRETVIEAIRDVENALTKIEMTSKELDLQSEALKASRKSLEITNNQYLAGLVSYLDVIQVQNSNINAEIKNLNLKLKLVQNQIELIKALGGHL